MNLYGLIGYPLGHSFSSEYFNEKFKRDGLSDCFFQLFPIEHICNFTGMLADNPSLKGLAVTIPYKQTIIPFLHKMTAEATAIGAVNCINITDGLLTGHNTDVKGFELSFTANKRPYHNKALVLGTGGASKAVQFILRKLQIPFLLVSRISQGLEGIISYEEVNHVIMEECNIIVNCSPVGMSPHVDSKPSIPYQYLSSEHYLYDLVYKPAETQFLMEGNRRGATTKNGFEMLIIQAEENWRIWNT